MAKFIIEVSDGYIRERANMENIIAANKEKPGDVSVNKSLMEMLAFGTIEKQLDGGKEEFFIDSKNFSGEELRVFNTMMLDVCAAVLVQPKEKKQEQLNSEENGSN